MGESLQLAHNQGPDKKNRYTKRIILHPQKSITETYPESIFLFTSALKVISRLIYDLCCFSCSKFSSLSSSWVSQDKGFFCVASRSFPLLLATQFDQCILLQLLVLFLMSTGAVPDVAMELLPALTQSFSHLPLISCMAVALLSVAEPFTRVHPFFPSNSLPTKHFAFPCFLLLSTAPLKLWPMLPLMCMESRTQFFLHCIRKITLLSKLLLRTKQKRGVLRRRWESWKFASQPWLQTMSPCSAEMLNTSLERMVWNNWTNFSCKRHSPLPRKEMGKGSVRSSHLYFPVCSASPLRLIIF